MKGWHNFFEIGECWLVKSRSTSSSCDSNFPPAKNLDDVRDSMFSSETTTQIVATKKITASGKAPEARTEKTPEQATVIKARKISVEEEVMLE